MHLRRPSLLIRCGLVGLTCKLYVACGDTMATGTTLVRSDTDESANVTSENPEGENSSTEGSSHDDSGHETGAGEGGDILECKQDILREGDDAVEVTDEFLTYCEDAELAGLEVVLPFRGRPAATGGELRWARHIAELEGQRLSSLTSIAALQTGVVSLWEPWEQANGSTRHAIAFDSAGDIRWSRALAQFSTNEGLASAANGGFFAYGQALIQAGQKYPRARIVKYDAHGTEQWASELNSDSARMRMTPEFVRERVDGRIAVVGTSNSEDTNTQSDALIALLGPDGTELWQRHYNAFADHSDAAKAAALPPGGGILGLYTVNATGQDLTGGLLFVDDTGSDCSLAYYDQFDPDFLHSGKPLALYASRAGKLYMGGQMYHRGGWVAEYDGQYRARWRRFDLAVENAKTGRVKSIAEASNGDLIVLSVVSDCPLGEDPQEPVDSMLWLHRMDNEGHTVWRRLHATLTPEQEPATLIGASVVVDPVDDTIYVRAGYTGEDRVLRMFVAAFEPTSYPRGSAALDMHGQRGPGGGPE